MMGNVPKSSAIQRCRGWILIPVFGLNWQLHWNLPRQTVTWRQRNEFDKDSGWRGGFIGHELAQCQCPLTH